MIYGNPDLKNYEKHLELEKKFINKNFDKDLNLTYSEPTKQDIINLFNLYNSFPNNFKIKIANYYDDPISVFKNKFFKNNPNITNCAIDKYINYINEIINYYIFKYKLKFNAPRPFQLANKYNIPIYPVALITTHTPSYPSGHAALYHGLYKFFNNIDPYNNYEDILNNGLKSRIIAAVHFEQDNIASKKIIDEIFKNDPVLKNFN